MMQRLNKLLRYETGAEYSLTKILLTDFRLMLSQLGKNCIQQLLFLSCRRILHNDQNLCNNTTGQISCENHDLQIHTYLASNPISTTYYVYDLGKFI